jgi:hypothetical protein
VTEPIDRDLLEVETLLRQAASDLVYPPTPDIASQVRVRINEAESARTWRPEGRRYRLPALALSGLLAGIVIAFGALVAVPASRTALADFFRLDRISFLEDSGSSPTPPVLSPASFARPSTVDEVRGIVDFTVSLPADAEPDAVYIQGEQYDLPYAIFAFEDYDLYETRDANIQKLINGSAPVREAPFDGVEAYWVEAGGHVVQSLDAEGRLLIETRRTVDRATLVWQEDGVTYRIESSLPLDETIAVAQSLR